MARNQMSKAKREESRKSENCRISLLCLLLSTCFLLIFPYGCARLATTEKTKVIKSTVDLSTTENEAKLNFCVKAQPQEVTIEFYQVNIDNFEPFLVAKESYTEITLDAGHHVIQVNPLKDKNAGEFQGKATTKEFFLDRHKIVTLQYTGSLWANSAGKIIER